MLCSRVPLYRAMYSTTARQADAWVGPGRGIDELALHRGEEALRHGVIAALAFAAHGQGGLAVFCEGGVGGGGVLGSRGRNGRSPPARGSRAATALASASATSSVRR